MTRRGRPVKPRGTKATGPGSGDIIPAVELFVEWLAAKLEAVRAREQPARPSLPPSPPVPPACAVIAPGDRFAASPWFYGARTVRQAAAETGLSRQLLWDLMREDVLIWKAHGGNGTRLIAWKSIVEYLEALPSAR